MYVAEDKAPKNSLCLLLRHATGSLTSAAERSGYQAIPHPSGFSWSRPANSRNENSAETGAAKDKPSSSHMLAPGLLGYGVCGGAAIPPRAGAAAKSHDSALQLH